ncbi:MAG: hypothetical protein KJ025_05560 [Burkholderiales bacterium]|nr:hypothetical protein [Burkholderiales bacterium]
MRAIVNVRERALSGLLGDSENPAHTEWQERSPRFKEAILELLPPEFDAWRAQTALAA